MALRPLYEKYGAEEYYKAFGDQYENPHEEQVRALIKQNSHRFDPTAVLDFAAGGGEVSLALLDLGYQNIQGADPFTHELYRQKTQMPCATWSFEDIVKEPKTSETFSCIICSFAMHLCPQNLLFSLSWNLLQMAPQLLIVTPHKRPALEQFEGIQLEWEDAVLTEKGKQVRLKSYVLSNS